MSDEVHLTMADHATPPQLPCDEEAGRVLLDLVAANGVDTSLSPTDVARTLAPDDHWQRALPLVRRIAVRLAREGRLLILRKGKVVNPDDFRGVYRLALPRNA